ncbi:DUF4403 family protein [Deinococcus altitudinis]|uniref:DUF4403 family protein n=1 Tax=Deinococcus altitudinis TaxID=468914 RepID=UPI003891206B
MTLTTSLPAQAATPTLVPPTLVPQSSLSLPVTMPLSSLKAAALSRLPTVLGSVDQVQTLAGGLVTVQLTGEVRRSGELQLVPDGDGLRLSLPVTATFRATPVGLGDFLARDFSGSAVVTAHVTPSIAADWNVGLQVQADYRWTAPLSFELLKGVSINVQSLVDPQIRSRLGSVSEAMGTAARNGLKLRERAGELWSRLAQPWTLPGLPGSYAAVRPQGLSVTPVRFGPEGAGVTLGGNFAASAGLGQPPAPQPAGPLPPLRIGPPPGEGVTLEVPVTLAYGELSALATRYAQSREYPLPLPFSPQLKVRKIVLSTPAVGKLNAAVQLTVRALGLSVGATVDVSGMPSLDGQRLTLQNVHVKTRPNGLSGRVLGWLADSRVQSLVAKQASFDLGPELVQAGALLQSRLPYRVASGVTLSGQVGRLALRSVVVQPQGVVALTRAQGVLEAQVELKK